MSLGMLIKGAWPLGAWLRPAQAATLEAKCTCADKTDTDTVQGAFTQLKPTHRAIPGRPEAQDQR